MRNIFFEPKSEKNKKGKKEKKKKERLELMPVNTSNVNTKAETLATHEVNKILELFDASFFITSSPRNFFYTLDENDKKWKDRVNKWLTNTPNLKTNQTYYNFFYSKFFYLQKVVCTSSTKEKLFLLYNSAMEGLEKIFFILLEQNPDIHILIKDFKHGDEMNATLAHAAAMGKNVDILQKLIDLGCNLMVTQEYHIEDEMGGVWIIGAGMRPLDYAAKGGADKCIEILLQEKNIDINKQNYSGRAPLHYAAEEGYLSCVKLLVEAGALLDKKDKDKKTPYELAKDNGHEEVCTYLAEEMQKNDILVPQTIWEKFSKLVPKF